MDRIVIVSNRVPKPEPAEIDAGGLAIGLRQVLEETGGLWFGWSGRISEAPNRTPSLQHTAPFALATIDLCEREHAGYYAGFANRSLWPLLHGRVDLMRFDAAEWATYRSVNDTFACNHASLLRPRDHVWVHDYHLILLGQSLRRLGVDAPLGFFLHVPFPAPDVLSALPCHEDLIRALSAMTSSGFRPRMICTIFTSSSFSASAVQCRMPARSKSVGGNSGPAPFQSG